MPILDLTDLELEAAARACRSLVRQEELAAKRIENPGMRGPFRTLRNAQRCWRLERNSLGVQHRGLKKS